MDKPTLEITKTEWPHRKVVFEFEHPTIGDDRMQPLIFDAFAEYALKQGWQREDLKTFTAENGIKITAHNATTYGE